MKLSLIRDINTGVDFAVKKNNMMFQSSSFGRRLLREIKVLKHLRGHPNVVLLSHITTFSNYYRLFV